MITFQEEMLSPPEADSELVNKSVGIGLAKSLQARENTENRLEGSDV
jgi:hypothetical protein